MEHRVILHCLIWFLSFKQIRMILIVYFWCILPQKNTEYKRNLNIYSDVFQDKRKDNTRAMRLENFHNDFLKITCLNLRVHKWSFFNTDYSV